MASGRLDVSLDLLEVFLGKRDLRVVLHQPITTPNVHVSQTCSPGAFAKSFDDHSSSNSVASSFQAGYDMILAAQKGCLCDIVRRCASEMRVYRASAVAGADRTLSPGLQGEASLLASFPWTSIGVITWGRLALRRQSQVFYKLPNLSLIPPPRAPGPGVSFLEDEALAGLLGVRNSCGSHM
eukprot:1156254-Pelagomonas_calceolata.AAC.1